MGVTGILAAIAVLGILIVVHEFGHFIVAKKSGVGVLKFSVGFGPKLFGRTVNGTEYVLSAIPLGGFVKMVGEDPDSDEPVDESISFSHQRLWKRCAIVLAGPMFNLIFAFIALSCMLFVYGMPVPNETAKVGMVQEGKPAAVAGFVNGDVVTAIDGAAISSWEELSKAIRASEGKSLAVDVRRGDEAVSLVVTPESQETKNLFGEVTGPNYFAIGIGHASDRRPVGLFEAIAAGFEQTVWWITTILMSVYKMVRGHIPAAEIGGPILIVQAAGTQAQVGLEALINFMSVISINLGILNLLPIPVLDGGHLLFFLIEAVMRRPLDLRQREMAQQVGLVILIGLMAFAFYNDIGRILGSWG